MGRAAMRALLRGGDGEAESGAGAVLPLAADRVFRRPRQRARDCVAGSRFAGAAEFSGCGTEGDAARSLDPLSHAATDRFGNGIKRYSARWGGGWRARRRFLDGGLKAVPPD